jgi:hypothetical protein
MRANKGKRRGDFPADSSPVIHERAAANIPRIMHKLQRSLSLRVTDLDQGLARSEESALAHGHASENSARTRAFDVSPQVSQTTCGGEPCRSSNWTTSVPCVTTTAPWSRAGKIAESSASRNPRSLTALHEFDCLTHRVLRGSAPGRCSRNVPHQHKCLQHNAVEILATRGAHNSASPFSQPLAKRLDRIDFQRATRRKVGRE